MNKHEKAKKLILSVFVILYGAVSLFWCCIILRQIIYDFSFVATNESSIGIIGGADLPTLTFMLATERIFGWIFSVLFLILSVGTVILLTLSIFKNKISKKYRVMLCILEVINLIAFILIPPQTYAVSLYSFTREFLIAGYLPVAYIAISAAVIAMNILLTMKKVK